MTGITFFLCIGRPVWPRFDRVDEFWRLAWAEGWEKRSSQGEKSQPIKQCIFGDCESPATKTDYGFCIGHAPGRLT